MTTSDPPIWEELVRRRASAPSPKHAEREVDAAEPESLTHEEIEDMVARLGDPPTTHVGLTGGDSARVICHESDPRWLEHRRGYWGASEAWAVVTGQGLAAVHAGKLAVPPPRGTQTEGQIMGHRLEALTADLLREETGREVAVWGDLMASTRWPHMAATPDAQWFSATKATKAPAQDPLRSLMSHAETTPTSWGIAQLKSREHLRHESWGHVHEIPGLDGDILRVPIPPKIWCQVQQEMAVTGATICTVAVVAGGGGDGGGWAFRWRDIERRDDWIEGVLVPAIEDAAYRLENDLSPRVDGSDACRRSLAWIFRAHSPEPPPIQLPGKLLGIAAAYEDLKANIAVAQGECNRLKNEICAAIGSNWVGMFADGSGYSWKPNKNGVRTLRRKESDNDRATNTARAAGPLDDTFKKITNGGSSNIADKDERSGASINVRSTGVRAEE